jgi:uncharacterized membrane protein YqgA involved in biofilm formation
MGIFTGSIINAVAIIIGGLAGLAIQKGIQKRFEALLMDTLALVIFLIGLMSALKAQNIMMLVISLAAGGLIGEALRLEDRLHDLALAAEKRFVPAAAGSGEGRLAACLVHASLVFCIGSMAIIGALESGLAGRHDTLLAKALLDGIISVFFAASLGPGVLLSAIPVLLYEGSMTAGAAALSGIMTETMLIEISAVGGVLIMALGVNMSRLKEIKVVNLLPSLIIAFIWVQVL